MVDTSLTAFVWMQYRYSWYVSQWAHQIIKTILIIKTNPDDKHTELW